MKGHHGHVYCPPAKQRGFCVPNFLHAELDAMLGAKSEEFDLLAWYVRQDKKWFEYGVISEPLTAWRDAFRAELACRGWLPPRKRPAYVPSGPPGWRPVASEKSGACQHHPACASMKDHVMRIVNDGRRARGVPTLNT